MQLVQWAMDLILIGSSSLTPGSPISSRSLLAAKTEPFPVVVAAHVWDPHGARGMSYFTPTMTQLSTCRTPRLKLKIS